MFFLRDDNVKLTRERKDMLATLDAVLGGVLLHSDDVSKYGPEAKARYRALRRLALGAKDVRVGTDGTWKLTYTLDHVPHTLYLENLP